MSEQKLVTKITAIGNVYCIGLTLETTIEGPQVLLILVWTLLSKYIGTFQPIPLI